MPDAAPWKDRDQLERWLAVWKDPAVGRAVHGARGGGGWASLQLAGPQRDSLFLGALPGAVILFPYTAPLPDALRTALPPSRRHPLTGFLAGAQLTGAALLAGDLSLQLTFATAAGPRFLRHQLFGSRGGIVLLAADGRMLWTAYPYPHPCLLDVGAPLAGQTGEAARTEAARGTPMADASPAGAPTRDLDRTWSLLGKLHLARQLEVSLGDRLQKALARRMAASRRLVENLSADLARADGGRIMREDAETLAIHLHTVQRGAHSISCPSPHDGSRRTIVLDPALSAAANLERLFRLARKAERGRQVIADRLAAATAERQTLQEASADLAAHLRDTPAAVPAAMETDTARLDRSLARLAGLQAFAERCRPLLRDRRPGRPHGSAEEPARPFRRYSIDGRWEVWIGRNSRENDLLTHQASHPRDLWLHAQSVEGSHVVLRTGGNPQAVPRPVIERAAALAALFSKARHSSMVPVVWTERRYVRRPRKTPPGTAVWLRAKSLFAAPGVAPGVEPA